MSETALDLRQHFHQYTDEQLIWANYVYAYFVDGLDDLSVEKEVNTQVRIRSSSGHFSLGPRPDYLSVYFPDASYTKHYRRQSGRLETGKYTINIPYFEEDELDAVKALVRQALKAQ